MCKKEFMSPVAFFYGRSKIQNFTADTLQVVQAVPEVRRCCCLPLNPTLPLMAVLGGQEHDGHQVPRAGSRSGTSAG